MRKDPAEVWLDWIDFLFYFAVGIFYFGLALFMWWTGPVFRPILACGAAVFFWKSIGGLRAILRKRACCKKLEFDAIAGKCRHHPDNDIREVVRRAAIGAKYWTFTKVWKKLRDSHDYGHIFRLFR